MTERSWVPTIFQAPFIWIKAWNKNCGKTKQWPLASELSKFEYLPEIRQKWQIQVLTKMAFFGNVPDSPDSPTFANLVCSELPDSPTCFARTCQTRRHLPKAILEKNVTCLAKFARVLSESREFGASGHSLGKTLNWHCCMCCYPANGRVDFEEWSAYKIQLHGIL
jgi:hypothetical protein